MYQQQGPRVFQGLRLQLQSGLPADAWQRMTFTRHTSPRLSLQTTATATGTSHGVQLWTHVCHECPTVQQSPQQRPAPPDPDKCCPRVTSSQTASVHKAVPGVSVTLLTSQRSQAAGDTKLPNRQHPVMCSDAGIQPDHLSCHLIADSDDSLSTPQQPCQSRSGCSC